MTHTLVGYRNYCMDTVRTIAALRGTRGQRQAPPLGPHPSGSAPHGPPRGRRTRKGPASRHAPGGAAAAAARAGQGAQARCGPAPRPRRRGASPAPPLVCRRSPWRGGRGAALGRAGAAALPSGVVSWRALRADGCGQLRAPGRARDTEPLPLPAPLLPPALRGSAPLPGRAGGGHGGPQAGGVGAGRGEPLR